MSAAPSRIPEQPPVMLAAALEAHDAGLCVVPPRQDGSKRPVSEWKRYQTERPSRDRTEDWYRGPGRAGIGFVCGRVSGGLELFEFDDERAFHAFEQLVEDHGLSDQWQRLTGGYLEATPSGGRHVLWYTDVQEGNQQLAKRPYVDDEGNPKVAVRIETRGEGGYVVAAPSGGGVHPTGGAYQRVCGGPASIQTITAEERETFFALARMLDEMPSKSKELPAARQNSGDRPGDRFNRETQWEDLLPKYGWTVDKQIGDETYWTRPGKDWGVSATTNYNGSGVLKVFTSSTLLEAGATYSQFAFYTEMEHEGNFATAARALAKRYRMEKDIDVPSAPYDETPAGLIYRRRTRDGVVEELLCNFNARIVEERIVDDGAGVESIVVIEGNLSGGPSLPRIEVLRKQFPSLTWPMEHWGTRTIITAGMHVKDRIREAIQRLSPDIALRSVYGHPGWRNIEGAGWVYLHAGGGIGQHGAVLDLDVALRGSVANVAFDPPSGVEFRDAVRASLALLDLGPHTVTAPLLGAVYRAPLIAMLQADLAVFVLGPSGVYKSELAALAMQHFGAGFDRAHLPAQWASTENALERIVFDFKDALCVIDDFAPTGTSSDIDRLHKTADRLIRGIGNQGGRSRMNVNGTLRANYPPRGLVLGTGEDAPKGHSLRARTMFVELSPGDIDTELLTRAQANGRKKVFVAGMAGYLQWVAAHFAELQKSLPDLFAELRAAATGSHAHTRTPEAVAHIALGWKIFLRYAEEVGAITEREATVAFTRTWDALGAAAEGQRQHQETQEPARQFIDALGSVLSAGLGHVATKEGSRPEDQPSAWGWRERQPGEWAPQGLRIGWLDGDDLYINVDSAVAAARPIGAIPVTSRVLVKRLHERGYVKSTEGKEGIQVRRVLEGTRMRVLHLSPEVLGVETADHSGQSGQDRKKPEQRREKEMIGERILWPVNQPSGRESDRLAGNTGD